MINYDTPYTYENSENPWIMDTKDLSDIIEINGNKISAEFLWSLNKEEREKYLTLVFNYYRQHGFPYENISDAHIMNQFCKLIKYNINNVITSEGFISNSGNLCLDVCRYFCNDKFYKAKGDLNSKSLEDIFFDDELFIKVLKNRMGWNTSKEGGIERPYMFGISDRQIRNGIKNSGLGYGVSNFRPTIGKFMYKHAEELLNYEHDYVNVFDYSAGWGARALASLSLGFNYFGTDPSTADNINNLCRFINNNSDLYCLDLCSEDKLFQSEEYKEKFDIIGSCPPYFDLEIYDDKSDKQCTRLEYNNWLSEYWEGSVKNFSYMIKNNGIFILVIKESNGKYELLKDMNEILNKYGFFEIESFQYKTTTNHLSGKTKTGRVSKNNEFIKFYAKRN